MDEIPEDTIERLLLGKATSGDQLLSANALQQLDVCGDVYIHIADMIEPYVERFGKRGELPASVTDSFDIIFKFWLANKDKS